MHPLKRPRSSLPKHLIMPQEVAAAKPSSTLTKKLFEIFTEYRGVVMVGIVLPLSFAMELAGELRDWFFRTFQV